MPWIMSIFALVVVGVGTFAWSFVDTHNKNIAELTQCRHSAQLFKQREESYKLRIERRDEAIKASRCRVQIENWIKNPDDIPRPTNPFEPKG